MYYNGARDNAIGTLTAFWPGQKKLAKYPTKTFSPFYIVLQGEEIGAIGKPKYYVQNPVYHLIRLIYCFNTDVVGYNNTTLAKQIGRR